jgi:uncharacterized membrane protein
LNGPDIKRFRPENLFVVLALLFGIANIFLTPFGTGYDEWTHLSRTWEISRFHLLTEVNATTIYLPVAFTTINWRINHTFVDPISLDEYLSKYKVIIEPQVNPESVLPTTTRSSYFPSMYFPAALVMGIFARILNNFPVMMTVTLIRLVNFLIFLMLSFLAIQKIPFGKWVLFALLLAPEVIYMSSIVNIDYSSYGVSALFLSWVLYLSFKREKVTRKDYWILLALIFGLFTLKVNYAVLGILLFLIPKEQFSKTQKTILVVFTVGAFFLLVIGWYMIAASGSGNYTEEVSISGQAAYIFSHPALFMGTLAKSIVSVFSRVFREWIAVYAYGVGVVPPLIYLFFMIGLLIFSVFRFDAIQPTRTQRIFLVSLGCISFLAIFVIFYLAESNVGGIDIRGINGRYFFASALLLLLGTSGLMKEILPYVMKIIATVLIAISQGFFIYGIFATFYVFCGANTYVPGLCYLPSYKNLEKTAFTTKKLPDGFVLYQTFVPECDAIEEIAFYLAPESDPHGSIIFELYEMEPDRLIHSTKYAVSEKDLAKQLHFPFPKVTGTKGKKFIFTIRGTESDSQGLSFSTSAKDEYEMGDFTVNGSSFHGDLYFQYGCNLHH